MARISKADLLKKQAETTTKAMKQTSTKAKATMAKQLAKPFAKPSSDYYRLDLVVRGTVKVDEEYKRTRNGKTSTIKRKVVMQTDEVIKDYKTYLTARANAENVSITKYIHNLIDADMKKHK